MTIKVDGSGRVILSGSAALNIGQILGTGLNGAFAQSTAFPFLNAMNNNNRNWITSNSGTFDTSEEAYLQLDSNGYCTSLTLSPVPAGGQLMTYVQLLIYPTLFQGAPPRTPPNTTNAYPADYYNLTFQGAGTIKILSNPDSDFSTMTVPTGSGSITLSGNGTGANGLTGATTVTVTSTLTGTNQAILRWNIPSPTNGVTLQLTTINANYFKAMSFVQDSHLSAYQGGQLINPDWLNTLKTFSVIRFMDWMQTNNSVQKVSLTAIPGNGANSGTLTANWTQASGTYYVAFDTGDEVIGTFTTGSTAVTWTPNLSKAGTATTIWYSLKPTSWANRPTTSAIFWANNFGPPMEAITQTCNQAGADAWINIPPEMLNADITSLLTFMNSNLNAGLHCYVEYANETWNSGFTCGSYNTFRGNALWSGATQPSYSYSGKRTADIADLSQAISTTRFKVIMGAQAANTFVADQKLTAPDWVNNGGTVPWSAHAIAGICIDQYWMGNNYPPAWLNLTQAQFLTNFFGEAQGGGVVAGGYPGGAIQAPLDRLNKHVTRMNSTYGGLAVYAYEGDPNTNSQQTFLSALNGAASNPSKWAANTSYNTLNAYRLDTNGNLQQVTGTGTSGGSAPSWATTIGNTTTDNTVTWTRVANYAYNGWSANHGYSWNATIFDSNGNPQSVSTPLPGAGNGTSGGSAPSWATTVGATTTDNAVTWTRVNNRCAPWIDTKAYVVGDCIWDYNYNMQVCTTAGTSGGSKPTWSTSNGGTTTDGGVTWTLYMGSDNHQDSAFFVNFCACDNDSRMAAPLLAWLRQFYANSGKLMCYFVGDYGIYNKYGDWAAAESLEASVTPIKLQTLLNFITSG